MKKLLLLLTLSCSLAVGQTVRHHAFTIYYNAKNKAPDSVSWNLTPSMLNCGKVVRVDMFAQDPLIKNGPKPSDFVNTTKDKTLEIAKGHLFSFEDAACNPIDKKECFYVSQMYAQYQLMNAGDWKTVEVYERSLASKSAIHVIAGYIGIASHLKAGEIVPNFMYKAILSNGKYTAWIMPNQPTSKGHKYNFWEVSLKTLDSETGLSL